MSKKFCRDLKKSLWYGVQDVASEVMGRKYEHKLRPNEFWAVKDVSFELRRGECLGLIGHNGAGKTTLLKMLNGLIKPDQGQIAMKGRVGALIALGAGFNPILTGRENIYVNASVLGISKKEINAKIDDIIEFAEIGDFIDTPVQNYSSGMQVRLGFSVAVNMNPDILLIDEVLAVGDVGFKQKAYAAIYEVIQKSAVIFVSHSLPQIGKVCNRGLLMRRGEIGLASFQVGEIIDAYFEEFHSSTECRLSGTGNVKLLELQLSSDDSLSDKIRPDQPLREFTLNCNAQVTIKLSLEIDESIEFFHVGIGIRDMEMKGIAQCFSINSQRAFKNNSNCSSIVELNIPNLPLNKGIYEMTLYIFKDSGLGISGGEMLSMYENILVLRVVSANKNLGAFAVQLDGTWRSS